VNSGQNCVGLIVDPTKHDLGFSFSVEFFEAGSVTEMTTNPGYELFYVLSGSGTAFCMDVTGGGAEGGVKVGPWRTEPTKMSTGREWSQEGSFWTDWYS